MYIHLGRMHLATLARVLVHLHPDLDMDMDMHPAPLLEADPKDPQEGLHTQEDE
jgi:hypothetical protein